MRMFSPLLFLLTALSAVGLAQEPRPGAVATVPELLEKLEDNNEAVVEGAAQELTKRGPTSGTGARWSSCPASKLFP
jgi:hypothetical protein